MKLQALSSVLHSTLKENHFREFTLDQLNILTAITFERKKELEQMLEPMKKNDIGRKAIQNKIIMINDASLALRTPALPIDRDQVIAFYDELCAVLTKWECSEITPLDLYCFMVDVAIKLAEMIN